MQRYRINYTWLIGFFVSCLVFAVTSYFVWSWQVERKAGNFVEKAEAALAEDDALEAFRYFYRYVQLRPKEEEARIKLATSAVEVLKGNLGTIETQQQAYRLLNLAVRTTGDAKLRRELAQITNAQESINLLQELLDENPQDSELNGMLVRSLFRAKKFDEVRKVALNLIGYDKKTDEFDPEKATLKGEVHVYALLSQVLAQRDKEPELARRVIEQMVDKNPEDAQAYFNKSIYLAGQKEFDEASKALDEAYRLDPSDAMILSRKGMVALSDPKYVFAKMEYLDAIENFADAAREIDAQQVNNGDLKEARSALEEAIPNLEKSKPTYEESIATFNSSSAEFASAVNNLESALSDKLTRADELDRDSFNETLAELRATKATFESALPQPEKALEFISQGLKEHPDNVLFYKLMAQAQQRLDKTEEALKTLDDGIAEFDRNRGLDLVIYKIDLLLTQEDYEAIDEEIDRLRKANRVDLQPIIDFQKARVEFTKQNWAEASKQLKRVRPLLFNFSRFQTSADVMLGISYESQGFNDLAYAAYETVLQSNPGHSAALSGMKRVKGKIGQSEGPGVELDEIVNKTLELPENEQDWAKVDELVDEVVEKNNLGVPQQKLLQSKILIKRGRFDEAKAMIRDAASTDKANLNQNDKLNIQYTAILLVLSDPNQGAPVAMKMLDRLEKNFGRTFRSIVQRADVLAQLNPEDVSQQLRGLVTAAKELPEDQKISEAQLLQLYKIIGLKFEQLAKVDESREFYQMSAELEPNNLPLRMHLFDLAVRERNDAAMEEAQQEILDFVKSKTHPNYILANVKRQIMKYGSGAITKDELAKAREQLDNALRQRPQWHELHITYGQLLLLLGEDITLALKHFDDALEYGPAKSNAVSIQVKLLVERGLYNQALERMRLLRKEIRPQLLGRLEAEILMNTGDKEEALERAQALVATRPNDAALQEWLSKMSQQAGQLDVATDALRKSLEKNSNDPDSWVRLIGLYIEQKQIDDVEKVIREAHLACDAEFLPMLTAKYYELLSRWQNAEAIYLATYGDRDDSLAISHRLADFYLLWSKKDEANIGKASVYINKILKAANEGKADPTNPHVKWARQKAARVLFSQRDYQQSLKAERLLRQSTSDGQMNIEEASLLADILIERNDPQSLLEAEQLLSQLREEERLPKKGALQLASILSRTGQWDEAKTLLRRLISDYKSDAAIRIAHIEMLIEHDEFSQAARFIDRLRDIDKTNPKILELSVRLASEQGEQSEVNRILNAILPKKQGAMTEKQFRQLFSVAQLASRYGAYDLAGQLFETAAQRDPSTIFDYTKFLAYHGDADKAIVLMKKQLPDRMDDVVQLANRMLSSRRDELGDKYDKDVDFLLRAALRDDPDSVTRQLARAEAYDTQGKHEDSIATYEKILSRDDLPTRLRALALNNLGFQLGLLGQRVDEAEEMINTAIETFGPVEDMLDTRAVVRIAQQKYELAIEDMRLALSVSQDPVKYFHLAKASALAGDGAAALEAWEKAKKHGFEKASLPILERESFDQIRQQIESLQTQSAKL